jgi:hypothetical protein
MNLFDKFYPVNLCLSGKFLFCTYSDRCGALTPRHFSPKRLTPALGSRNESRSASVGMTGRTRIRKSPPCSNPIYLTIPMVHASPFRCGSSFRSVGRNGVFRTKASCAAADRGRGGRVWTGSFRTGRDVVKSLRFANFAFGKKTVSCNVFIIVASMLGEGT